MQKQVLLTYEVCFNYLMLNIYVEDSKLSEYLRMAVLSWQLLYIYNSWIK